jgi:hypothetical protein
LVRCIRADVPRPARAFALTVLPRFFSFFTGPYDFRSSQTYQRISRICICECQSSRSRRTSLKPSYWSDSSNRNIRGVSDLNHDCKLIPRSNMERRRVPKIDQGLAQITSTLWVIV